MGLNNHKEMKKNRMKWKVFKRKESEEMNKTKLSNFVWML